MAITRSQATTSDQAKNPPYVSYRRRLGAFFLDVLLIYPFFWSTLASILSRRGVENPDDWACFAIGPVLYWVGFVALGATPASWLCDIRIVDERGCAPGFWRACRRSLVPGTVWVLVAHAAYLIDPRINALYEAHPVIQGALFWGGGFALMLYFWIYLSEGNEGDHVTIWHDAVAGTRVIPHRSESKAALMTRLGQLGAAMRRWSITHLREQLAFRLRGRNDATSIGETESMEGTTWKSRLMKRR